MSFESDWVNSAKAVDDYLSGVVKGWGEAQDPGLLALQKSMAYSLLSGGKRFRPVLCLWSCRLHLGSFEKALPVAAAIEMIHCYSLIHDDLPCMDNDDFRRGQPTNHKVFGEAMALLAGNGLMSYAVEHTLQSYKENPVLATQLCQLLLKDSGAQGMIGGQAIDMEGGQWTVERLKLLHKLKTGALIALSAEAGARVAGASPEEIVGARKFGESLGLAFQIADDLLDADKNEEKSFVALLGKEGTQQLLLTVSKEALSELSAAGPAADPLRDMVSFNQNRSH